MPQHLYKLVQHNNEHMQEAYQKWYARPVYTGTLDLNGIAELISRPSCPNAPLVMDYCRWRLLLDSSTLRYEV